jgi:hypothetical protein
MRRQGEAMVAAAKGYMRRSMSVASACSQAPPMLSAAQQQQQQQPPSDPGDLGQTMQTAGFTRGQCAQKILTTLWRIVHK